MHLMAAGGEEEVDIVVLLDHELGDEVGEADVGEKMVILLDVLPAVDASFVLAHHFLYCVVLLQHRLLVLFHHQLLLSLLVLNLLPLSFLLVFLVLLLISYLVHDFCLVLAYFLQVVDYFRMQVNL